MKEINKIINEIQKELNYDCNRTKFCHKLRILFTFKNIFKKIRYNNKTLLDIGCNTGIYDILFYKKDLQVDAFDIYHISKAKILSKSLDSKINFFKMSAENIKLSKQYDYIFCSEVLEHLNDYEKCISSMNKIIKKNGKIIISMPNLLSIYYGLKFIKELIKNKFDFKKIDNHCRFPVWKVTKKFKNYNFNIKVIGSVYFIPINKFEKMNIFLSKMPIIKYFGAFVFYEVSLK